MTAYQPNIPQWHKLPWPKLKLLLESLSEEEAKQLEGKFISVSIKALPIYEAAVRSYKGNYGKNANNAEDLEKRICGVAGSDALHASLNECGLFYRLNQLHALPTDWVDYDLILSPSRVKLEVKTTYSSGRYCNVNKNRWQKGKEPDAIISLRGRILEDQIIVEFMGWAFSKEVKPPMFELRGESDRTYYRCKFEKLHPPVDIHKFLTGLANSGDNYLKQLAVENEVSKS